jgi:hypothetical protein
MFYPLTCAVGTLLLLLVMQLSQLVRMNPPIGLMESVWIFLLTGFFIICVAFVPYIISIVLIKIILKTSNCYSYVIIGAVCPLPALYLFAYQTSSNIRFLLSNISEMPELWTSPIIGGICGFFYWWLDKPKNHASSNTRIQ